MNSSVATPATSVAMCFAAHVDGRLPSALREPAHSKSFDEFVGEYAPATGPIRTFILPSYSTSLI